MNNGVFDLKRKIAFAAALLVVSHSLGTMPVAVASPSAVNVQDSEKKVNAEENNAAPLTATTNAVTTSVTTSAPVIETNTTTSTSSSTSATTTTSSQTTSASTVTTLPAFEEYTVKVNVEDFSNAEFSKLVTKIFGANIQLELDENNNYNGNVKVPYGIKPEQGDIMMSWDKVKFKLVSSKNKKLVYDVYYKVEISDDSKYWSFSDMPEDNFFKHGSAFKLSPSKNYLIEGSTEPKVFTVNGPLSFKPYDLSDDGCKFIINNYIYTISARKFSVHISDYHKVRMKGQDGNFHDVDPNNLRWMDIKDLYIYSPQKRAIIISYGDYTKNFDISDEQFAMNELCSISKFAYVKDARFNVTGVNFKISVQAEYEGSPKLKHTVVNVQKGTGDKYVISVPYLENDNYKLVQYRYINEDHDIDTTAPDKSIDTVKYYNIEVNDEDDNIIIRYKKINSANDYNFAPAADVSKRSNNCYTIDAYSDTAKLMKGDNALIGSKAHYAYYNSKGLLEGVDQISKVEDWSVDRSTDKTDHPKFIFLRNILEKDDELKSHLNRSVCFYKDENSPRVEAEREKEWSGKKGLNVKIKVDDTEECPVSDEGDTFYEQNFIRDVYKNYINAPTEDKQEIKSIIVDDYRFDRPEGGWKNAKNMSGYVESAGVRIAEAKLITALRKVDLGAVDASCKGHADTYDFYRDFIKNNGCENVANYYSKRISSFSADDDDADALSTLKKESRTFNSAFSAYKKAVDNDISDAAVSERMIVPTLTFNDREDTFTVNIKALDEYKNSIITKDVKIYAIDNSNNVGDTDGRSKSVTVNLDGSAPVIDKSIGLEGDYISVGEKDGFEEFVIKVGTIITASITDKGQGVSKAEVHFDKDADGGLVMVNSDDKNGYKYEIKKEDLEHDLKSVVTIAAQDKDENEGSLNSGEITEKFKVIVDNTAPESSIVNNFVPENCYCQEIDDGENITIKKWFRDYSDIRFDITAADKNPYICSGIKELKITVNNKSNTIELSSNNISEAELSEEGNYFITLEAADTPGHFNAFLKSNKNAESKVLVCEDIACAGDNIYDENNVLIEKDSVRIIFSVVDYADNESSRTSETVYVDLSDPCVVSAEANGTDLISDGDFTYEVFSRTETTVRIRVNDAMPSSGIAKVYATLCDENDNIVAQKIAAERDEQSDSWIVNIPVNFKGYLTLYAEDNVKRSSAEVKTKGIITEDGARHSDTSDKFIVLPDTNHRDREGRPLYSDDVRVNLTAQDSFSGLAEIITSVTGRNIAHTYIGTYGEIYGDEAEAWKNTDNNRDKNLVTELSRELLVTQDSNNISIDLDLKDRAGNPDISSPSSVNFSIDKTDPKIDVRYTDINGNPENGSNSLFNTPRRAVITITERNFDGELAEVYVNGSRRSLSWNHSDGTEGTDNAQYRAEILFEADGNYDLNVKCRDMGGRTAEEYDQKFEIDRTAPKLDVVFDRNVSNDRYYNDAVTATFRISDANFDPARINLSGTFNQKSEGFPKASEWTRSGSDYVSTIRFDKNGEYEVIVKGSDKAGNPLETYIGRFCVDTQKPVIAVNDMQRSNNAGEIRPRIQFNDVNIDKDSIRIELQGANRGRSLEYSGELIEKKDGYEYVFDNFPQTVEYDDIYTIKASAKDNADNKIEKEVNFSVNRFGSTFILDESTAFIVGKFISEPRDIIITERNPDKHAEESSVFVTKDAEMIKLKKGSDYKVMESGGNGEWSEYKYIIFAKNFDADAKYTVSVHSEDEAGNLNVSAALKNNASISFSVDKTSPLCIPINISDNSSYKGESYIAKLSISDNISLKDVRVLVDGLPVATNINNDECTFEIYNSTSAQEVSVILTDMADNKIEYNYKNILVTTSVLRILARKTWFKISCGVTMLFAGTSAFFFRRRRRLR